MACIPRDLEVALEGAIDAHGLDNVVDGLSEICAEKADHVRTYQDSAELARRWDRAAMQLRVLEAEIALLKLHG